MTAFLIIDGSHGEGGGQILRSTLSLAVITGRPVHIENIRANRKKPGLAAQHLTSVRAAAMLCDAEVKGAELGSQTLQFIPRKPVRAGDYFLDVAQAREGGSAGSVMLVLQTLLLPLALAVGDSTVILRGGTHVDMSPSYDYRARCLAAHACPYGCACRTFPRAIRLVPGGARRSEAANSRGGGTAAHLFGTSRSAAGGYGTRSGRQSARPYLRTHGYSRTRSSGAGRNNCGHRGCRFGSGLPRSRLYLTAHYENSLAGFSAQGKRGKPAERVAEEACAVLLHHYRVRRGSGTASRRSVDSAGRLVPGRIRFQRRAHQSAPRHQRLGG